MTKAPAHVREIFREEATERIDRMVELLLAVEAETVSAAAIDALFREAHSLKGAAGLVGFEDLRTIAHAIEEVLSDAREQGVPLPSSLADPLLGATDVMRRALAGEVGVADEALARLGHDEAAEASARSSEPVDEPAPQHASTLGSSLRVSADKVDRLLDDVGEALVHQRGLEHLLDASPDERVGEALERGELLLDELQHSALRLRALPLASIVGPFPRFVRDLALEQDKQVELTLRGTETQLDRAILDGLAEPLIHLLRNSIAHGIESPGERRDAGKPERGTIELRAEQRGNRVTIEVADDGRGVSPELLRQAQDGSLAGLLARPGFSTAGSVSDIAGRGVGLDAVKSHVESLGGSLEAASEPGRGTSITLLLPLTLAVLHALLVEQGGQVMCLPVANVAEVVAVENVVALAGVRSLEWQGETVPLADLAAVLGGQPTVHPTRPPALIVTHGGDTAALVCDRLVGEEKVIVKGLGPVLGSLPGYLGGSVLADGRVALVVDPAVAVARASGSAARSVSTAAPTTDGARPTSVLVVDDQFTIRELQRSILEAAGYHVVTATGGRDALDRLAGSAGIDIVVTDIQMPGMDGLELLREIRDDTELSSLPVVVLTSLASDDDRRRGLEAGADAYVTKDRFDQRALLETVGRLVGP